MPAAVEVVKGDLADPASIDGATAGADGASLLWPFPAPERADELAAEVVQRLARTGRIVYLPAEASIRAPDRFWGRVERVLERIVPRWTVLRPTGLASNARIWAGQIRTGDVVRWPFADARRSLIHERDIAAVAARALLRDGHDGRRYVITGPSAIRHDDQVRDIGFALGRELRWEALDRDAALSLLVEQFGDAEYGAPPRPPRPVQRRTLAPPRSRTYHAPRRPAAASCQLRIAHLALRLQSEPSRTATARVINADRSGIILAWRARSRRRRSGRS